MAFNFILPTRGSRTYDYWGIITDIEGNEYYPCYILDIAYKENDKDWVVYDGDKDSSSTGRESIGLTSRATYYFRFTIKEEYRNLFKFNTDDNLKIWLFNSTQTTQQNYDVSNFGTDLFDDNDDKGYLKIVFDGEYTFYFGFTMTQTTSATTNILMIFAEVNNGWNYAYSLTTSQDNYTYKQIFAEISDSTMALYSGTFYEKGFSFREQFFIAVESEISYIPLTELNSENSIITITCNNEEISIDKIELGTTISIKSVSSEGYIFKEVPYIKYRNSETDEYTQVYFEKINDYEYVLNDFFVDNSIYELIINSECEIEESEKEYLEVITALENCDCKFIVDSEEIEIGEIEKGSILTIELTAIDGYYFSDSPTYSYRDKSGNSIKRNFTKETDYFYTLSNFDTSNVNTNLTITANAILESPEPTIQYLTGVLDLSQCTIKAYNETGNELDIYAIEKGTIITFIITANENYYFATVPTIVYYDIYGNQVTRNFSISENNPDNNYPTIYIYTFDSSIVKDDSSYDFLIHANATIKHDENPDTGFTGNYGIVTYYNPTIENLRSIASDRQYIKESSYYVVIVDKGDFIAELRQVFMYVEVGENETCYLGGYNMGFDCPVIASLIQNIEVGTLTIPEKYNNAYDYINVTLRVYLPFYGFFDLDPSYCINKTLHIYYRVYVPTGDTVIIIEVFNDDTLNYDVIYSLECNISFKIPYLVQGQAYDTANLFTNHKLLYGFTPFIEITRYMNQNSLIVKSYNNEYVQLKNLQGFCKCEEIFNNIKTTNEEKNLINTILTNGFII